MEMIAVDPKLFITCRLCLDEMGMYQIVPQVQEQIKYCFDIDVNPFDRLPQLICGKCHYILSEYFKIKKKFVDKQDALKLKKVIKVDESSFQAQQETVSSNQDNENKNANNLNLITNEKNSTTAENVKFVETLDNQNRGIGVIRELVHHNYKKILVCRLCHKNFCSKDSLNSHVKVHNKCFSRYRDIFAVHCTVNLNKVDNDFNKLGNINTIVYNQDKIISNEGDVRHFVVYLQNVKTETESIEDKTTVINQHTFFENGDSSDEDIFLKQRPTKRRRILSRSSNETVVLESETSSISKSEEKSKVTKSISKENIDFINIADSSDSDSSLNKNNKGNNNKDKLKSIKPQDADYTKIQSIISNCHRKYLKKINITENNGSNKQIHNESHLKRKVLSLGRKILSKEGLNCTGLLRYLEHKNLPVKWIPIHSPVNQNKEKYNVRIMTKLRGKEGPNDNLGWKSLPKRNLELRTLTSKKLLNSTSHKKYTPQFDLLELPDDNKKLLNANPVANPKKLPKKSNGIEIKSHVKSILEGVLLQNATAINDQDNEPTSVSMNNRTHDRSMPIITSTTSLADGVKIDKNEKNEKNGENFTDGMQHHAIQKSNVTTSNTEKPTPRIKVKSASELMPATILNNTNQIAESTNNWNGINSGWCPDLTSQRSGRHSLLNVSQNLDAGNTNLETSPTSSMIDNTNCDYVILDTVELPNTKTDSPFKYFQKLLQIHDIILLDSAENITRDFFCLIKFKLVYQRFDGDTPIMLCLTLQCYGNKFCIAVRDPSQQNLGWQNLSVNWQWEILKVYKGDIVTKLLQNAQKISQEVYDNTNNFLCLLKSINFKSDTN